MDHGKPAGDAGAEHRGAGESDTDTDYCAAVSTDPLLMATASALLVLDRQLRIRAANPEYLRLTARRLDDLLGRELIEAYPAGTAATMVRSARRVLRRGTRDRVDARESRDALSATHSPLFRDGALLGVLHQVDRVRPAHPRLPHHVVAGTVVNQAVGMLMGWHGCSPQEAFTALRTFAANRDMPLRNVAGAVVREGCGPAGSVAMTDLDWLLGGLDAG